MRVALAGLMIGALASTAYATDPADVAAEVSSEVMSPYCEGITLHDCPSAAAVKMRARIESWARDGLSKERILERIEAEWGEGIRAAPEPSGVGLLAWLFPVLAVLAGAGAVVVIARRWRSEPRAETSRTIAADERARLDAEVARYREQT